VQGPPHWRQRLLLLMLLVLLLVLLQGREAGASWVHSWGLLLHPIAVPSCIAGVLHGLLLCLLAAHCRRCCLQRLCKVLLILRCRRLLLRLLLVLLEPAAHLCQQRAGLGGGPAERACQQAHMQVS
jgi:hypothetical protein